METILIPDVDLKSNSKYSENGINMWVFLGLHLLYILSFGVLIFALTIMGSLYSASTWLGILALLSFSGLQFVFLILGFIFCFYKFIYNKGSRMYWVNPKTPQFNLFFALLHLGLIVEIALGLDILFYITAFMYLVSFIFYYLSVFFQS